VDEVQPKRQGERGSDISKSPRPSHLHSLGLGLTLGALGSLPAWIPGCDAFSLLLWLSWFAPVAGVLLGASRIDPLRFGAVAPALWAVALVMLDAAAPQPTLASPLWGALAWTGLCFMGMSLGARTRSTFTSAAAAALATAVLIGLPARGAIAGEPWPPRAASALLDASPFVLLGECSGARDMAWHRSLYAAVGTDRFQRTPWNGPWTASAVLAVGCCLAWLFDRRRRATPRAAGD